MFGQFSKIYFHHLKKCAGTSFIRWLQTFVADGNDSELLAGFLNINNAMPTHGLTDFNHEFGCSAARVLGTFDFVHGHVEANDFVSGSTYRFTCLRDPRQRLLSQISDWRREAKFADNHGSSAAKLMRDANELSIRDFLRRYAVDGEYSHLLDNYLLRALGRSVSGYIGGNVRQSSADIIKNAKNRLEKKYDFVGIIEKIDEAQNQISSDLSRPPPEFLARENFSRFLDLTDEANDASEELNECVELDLVVYEHAVKNFEARVANRPVWDLVRFEKEAVHSSLSALSANIRADWVVFPVTGPLVGFGTHYRDGAGTPDCKIWTGPTCRSIFYIPVPSGVRLDFSIWVHGYAAIGQRDSVSIKINDDVSAHRFMPHEGVSELIVCTVYSIRNFAKIEIILPFTADYPVDEDGRVDPRMRGLSFDAIGWRVADQ